MGDEEKRIASATAAAAAAAAALSPWRWPVLALGSLALFCAYFALDVPSSTHDRLEAQFEGAGSVPFATFFGMIGSLYSVPNIVLPFVGGLLVSRLGAARMNVAFCTVCLLGQLLVAVGTAKRLMGVVLVGRAIFGIGGESLCVGVSALLAKWFCGGRVALALGLSLSVSRLGSVANDVASVPLADAVSLSFAFFFSAALMGLALLASLVVWWVDARRAQALVDSPRGVSAAIATPSVRALLHMGAPFYLLCLSCVAVYGVVIPWNSISSPLLIERICEGRCCPGGAQTCSAHAHAESQASVLMAIPYALSGLTVPVLGIAVDQYGKRAALTLLASIGLLAVHAVLLSSSSVLLVPLLVTQGAAYAIYAAALWPSVPLVVPAEQVGLAYGTITSVQNLGLAVVPTIAAYVRRNVDSYQMVEPLFVTLATVGVVTGVMLNWCDAFYHGGVLNASAAVAVAVPVPNEDLPEDEPTAKLAKHDPLFTAPETRIVDARSGTSFRFADDETAPLLGAGAA